MQEIIHLNCLPVEQKVVASDDSGNVNNLGIVTATTFSGNLTGNADIWQLLLPFQDQNYCQTTATNALGITTTQITVGDHL